MSLRKARSFRLVVQTVEADQSFMPVASRRRASAIRYSISPVGEPKSPSASAAVSKSGTTTVAPMCNASTACFAVLQLVCSKWHSPTQSRGVTAVIAVHHP